MTQPKAQKVPAAVELAIRNPLIDPPPADVPLANAPLVVVITQVKFSEVLSVESVDVVSKFQDAIKDTYGQLERVAVNPIQILFQGKTQQQQIQPVTHWRFSDSAEDWTYRCTLTTQFITLECQHYKSRDEFFDRLTHLLQAVAQFIKPHTVQRIGVRYVNRITGQELTDAHLLVIPEIAGVVATPMASLTTQSASEMVFALPGTTKLVARLGLLPPLTVIDAGIPPIEERCFMLDLDVFDEAPIKFDASAVAIRAKEFAQRSYTFFRWAVTEEFLRRYGGQP